MCYGNVNMNTGGFGLNRGMGGGYSSNPSVSFGQNQCDPFGSNQSSQVGLNQANPFSNQTDPFGLNQSLPLGFNQSSPVGLNQPNPFGYNQSSPDFNQVSTTKPENTTIGQMQEAKELCGEKGVKSFKKKSSGGISVGFGGKGSNIGISGDGETELDIQCN